MPDQPDIAARLAEVRHRFAAQLSDKLDELTVLGRDALAAVPSRGALETLVARLHGLAGSAGTFGFPELGSRARQLELLAKAWLESGAGMNIGERETFALGLAALREDARIETQAAAQNSPDSATIGADEVELADRTESLIFVVEDDVALGEDLVLNLEHFGYRARLHASLASAIEALQTVTPDALLLDIMFPAEGLDSTEVARAHPAFLNLRVPILFISVRNDFHALLGAARAGAQGYFIKPLDIPKLVDRLDRLLDRGHHEPHRILVVDDDQALAEHYRLVLAAANMEVRTVSDPRLAIEATRELRPELILMDVNMPDCSGPELARILRMDDEWIGVPIVYLSAESDMDIQMRAMGSGADDFLVKPISDRHLLASVKVRAARARQLADLVAKDSLTGLIKHARIKEQLAIDLSRAKREKTVLSVAMVDIDHFKSVNDTYGHGMGDRVIKALSHLLSQRTRRTDIVGRYGGEEFAVLFPNCDGVAAVKILDDIRERFESIRFRHEDREFSVTLSGGVATSTTHAAPDELLAAADEALYNAKRGGRNHVQTWSKSDSGR